MAVFKEGDWVRCVDNTLATGLLKLGAVYRVRKANSIYVYVDENPTGGMSHRRFEPWTPKVGERVRVSCADRGGDGSVIEVVDGHAYVTMDKNRRRCGYPLRYLEPLPVAAGAQPAAPDQAAPAPEQLTLQAGKFYKTRDGRKVGPMENSGRIDDYAWTDVKSRTVIDGYTRDWCDDGTFHKSKPNHPLDLIAEWPSDTTTNVAATVDALDEEYGPVVAVADVPVAKQKFKVGDVVRFRDGYAYDNYAGRKATVIAINVWRSDGVQIDMNGEVSTEKAADLVLVDEESESSKPPMIRTRNGYGFELARAGAYVWVDIGQKAPITVRADSIKAA